MKPFYSRNGITIYCGDCLEVMPLLEPHFDSIIADLPYDSIDAKWDSLIPLTLLWENYHRILKSNGVVALSAQDTFSAMLTMFNQNEYRHKWIWEKDKCGNFLAAQAEPLKVTEEILIFSGAGFSHNAKNRATYNPQMVKSDKFQKRQLRKKRDGNSLLQLQIRPNPTPIESSPDYDGWKRYPKNILYYPVDYGRDRLHPTQKPVPLMSYLIRTYTNPGEIILDNTMGSGTTLVASQNEGRRAVGIELSEEYCKIAVDRLRQPSLFTLPPNNANGADGPSGGFAQGSLFNQS